MSTPEATPPRPRVAIAHDYLTQRGGAERVVLALVRAFPDAPIYTTLYDPDGTYPEFADHDVRTSPLNRLRSARRHHRAALPVLPLASSRIDIDADIVIASSSGWAHGFRSRGAKVVYCYSPARWLYQSKVYTGDRQGRLVPLALRLLGRPLKRWDRKAARTADRYLAISTVVQQRIAECYGIDADILPAPLPSDMVSVPPVPVTTGWLGPGGPSFVLCVSRLLPYKNVHEVIEAMRHLPHLRLVVVGRGPERDRLREAAPDNVLMLEGVSDGQMRWLYAQAAAVVAASFEDFGLTPLEAAAQGTPSVVLRGGGFLDTMVEGRTAVFFDAPRAELIAEAVTAALGRAWDQDVLRAHAATFAEGHFAERMRTVVDEVLVTTPRRDAGAAVRLPVSPPGRPLGRSPAPPPPRQDAGRVVAG